MKKFFITLAALASYAFANAQDFKPTAGKLAFELNAASPFAASTPLSLPVYGFKARYLIADMFVGRLGLNWNLATTTTPKVLSNGIDKEDDKTSLSTFTVAPGIEKHFEGTERFSPYLGLIVPISFGSSETVTNSGVSATNRTKTTVKNANGFFSIGGSLLSGVDFYMFKNMYLGAEFGLSFTYMSQNDIETSNEVIGGPAIPNSTTTGGSSFNITPAANASFRFGYWF